MVTTKITNSNFTEIYWSSLKFSVNLANRSLIKRVSLTLLQIRSVRQRRNVDSGANSTVLHGAILNTAASAELPQPKVREPKTQWSDAKFVGQRSAVARSDFDGETLGRTRPTYRDHSGHRSRVHSSSKSEQSDLLRHRTTEPAEGQAIAICQWRNAAYRSKSESHSVECANSNERTLDAWAKSRTR